MDTTRDIARARIIVGLGWAFGLLACASAQKPSRCTDPVPTDFAALGTVYVDCQVDRRAVPEPTRPAPPTGFTPAQACGSVLIEFVVDEAGRPIADPIRVVRSNDSRLLEAMRADLHLKRYKPAIKNGVPVRQVVQSGFRYGVASQTGREPSSVVRASVPKC
jgi:hypothetical protein